jgi:hypothetical protein
VSFAEDVVHGLDSGFNLQAWRSSKRAVSKKHNLQQVMQQESSMLIVQWHRDVMYTCLLMRCQIAG